MSLQQTRQADAPMAQQAARPLDVSHVPLYLTMAQAAEFVGCKNVRSFYEWRKRHAIVLMGDGTIARADLDRIKRRKKQPRVMHPNSLHALRASRIQASR